MVDGWVRATATNPNNDGFFGSVPLIGVSDGQTVLRSWWNIGMYWLDDEVNVYPPGSSILRAGVVYDAAGLTPLQTPTPISNADADWMAITTINPSIVQLSQAVVTSWQINWGFPIDLSIKSQRRNETGSNRTLYLAWEMSLNNEVPGFTMSGWWCSIDSFIRTPD